jgi:hypothetical protein
MENLMLHVAGTNLSPIEPIHVGEKGLQQMFPQFTRYIAYLQTCFWNSFSATSIAVNVESDEPVTWRIVCFM